MQAQDRIIPVQTLDDSGKPPKSRIASASDCNVIADSVIYSGQERSRWNARIKGMFDGNPPYNPAKLKTEAQQWRANINFMEAKGTCSMGLVPFYDLFSGAKFFAEVQTDYGANENDRAYNSRIITEEFSRMLRSFKAFDFYVQQMLVDFVRFGRGFLTWPDKTDWRFICMPQHRVYVLDGTEATSENLEVLVIRQQMFVHQLWKSIKDSSAAEKAGWNVQGVVDAIRNAMPENVADSSTQYNFEWLQQKVKDRDLFEGVRASTVSVRHVLVKEFSGKVSHYIVEEYRGGNRREVKSGDKAESAQDRLSKMPGNDKDAPPIPNLFLKANVDYYDNWREFIATFFLETGDGSWNGAQGMGHDLYSMMALKDRAKCAGIDLMFLRTGITMQARKAGALQTAQMARIGPVTVLPPDFEVQKADILGDIEAPIVIDRLLDSVLTNNTGIYRPPMERQKGNPKTAAEIEARVTQQATLQNSTVSRFYGQLDFAYEEIYRRASATNLPKSDSNEGVKLAREFQDRVKKRGVDPKALQEVHSVVAYRNAGNGSNMMRQMQIQQTEPWFPLLPEGGKQAFLDYVLSSIHGQHMADAFNPKDPNDKLPSHDLWEAMMENGLIKVGAPAQWTPEQNDVVHAQTHLQAGAQAAATLQAGADPHDVLMFVDGIGKHTAQHLQQLEKSGPTRAGDLKPLQAQFKQLGQLRDELTGMVQQMEQKKQEMMAKRQQAMGMMNGNDPDTAIKAAQAANDIRIKNEKANSDLQRKSAKMRQDLAIKDARTAVDIEMKRTKAEADAENARAKAKEKAED